LTSLWVSRISNLLLGYAIVEIALGFFAFYFHDAFIIYLDASFNTVIPALNSPLPITLYKWLTASLIILPQSMLLGATFPLMAGGILRRFPGLSGYKTSVIYFVNTFGASIGVLVSGFYLVKKWGLSGAIFAAGTIDLFVGVSILGLWMYDRRARKEKMAGDGADDAININYTAGDADDTAIDIENLADAPDDYGQLAAAPAIAGAATGKPVTPSLADRREYYYPLLAIAGLTATASFIYEIGWIRMLSLVLGSSTHSFELMLSAFILGLALGSFFIRNKLDSIKNAPRFLGIVQIVMGATAILTLFSYGNMFQFMVLTLDGLDRTESGYMFFNIISHLICMAIMLPSTICAGMVIPLIIHMLYKRGYGEQTIGKVYAINTAGGIIGVVAAVWVLMELVGLKYLIIIGAVLDMGIGLYALYHFRETRETITRTVALPACIIVLAAALSFGSVDPVLASSGVFRYGSISSAKRVVGHIDGKTASITLFRSHDNLVLSTNGKPDASVGMTEEFSSDEYTMMLLGVLPLSVREETRTAAVIGLGAGMTSHYMLYDPNIELLDVIEIERAVVTLAEKIGPKVANNFNDPRCRIHVEDAKTFFSARNRTYDIIVSEPSNPWVSGVSSLFSKEFFRQIRQYLNDGGVLMQWFHKYEADITILASILKALGESFPVYDIYMAGSDLLIIAAKDPDTDISIKRDVFEIEAMAPSLIAMGFEGMEDFKQLRVMDNVFLDPLIQTYDTPPNSDYHSYVDLYAAKHRFMGSRVTEIDEIREFIIPVRRIVTADTGFLSLTPQRVLPEIYNLAEVQVAKILAQEIMRSALVDTIREAISAQVLILDYASTRPEKITFHQIKNTIIQILQRTLPHLSADEMRDIWEIIENKVSNKRLTEEEAAWMAYFRALCNYDAPQTRRLSLELLPEESISNHHTNHMLLTSLMAASVVLDDTTRIERVWSRYDDRNRPPIPLRAARAFLLDPRRRK
jgi:predicted membrane-bound spermidine synthase